MEKYYPIKSFYKIIQKEDNGSIEEIDYVCSDEFGNLFIKKQKGDSIEVIQLKEA